VGHLCGNGGGQSGDDCRVDLGLQGCSGFRHPKKKLNGNVAWSWCRRQQQLETEKGNQRTI
jgi:hypothetical protein